MLAQHNISMQLLTTVIMEYGEYYFSVTGCEDIDLKIYINTFQMDDPEKTYVCRIDCKFNEWDDREDFFWAVTLKRTQLNQFP